MQTYKRHHYAVEDSQGVHKSFPSLSVLWKKHGKALPPKLLCKYLNSSCSIRYFLQGSLGKISLVAQNSQFLAGRFDCFEQEGLIVLNNMCLIVYLSARKEEYENQRQQATQESFQEGWPVPRLSRFNVFFSQAERERLFLGVSTEGL